jgi:hypothetical protein
LFFGRTDILRNKLYKFLEPERNTIGTLFYELIIFGLIFTTVAPSLFIRYPTYAQEELIRQVGIILTTIIFFDFLLR